MALIDNLIVFVVGIVIGGLGIHFGAIITIGKADYTKAILTAVIGAVVWSIVGFFLGWMPFLGPIITF